MIITQKHALKAVLQGACFIPTVGACCSTLSTADLIWAEENSIASENELNQSELPLWLRSGDGSGDGYGYGDGSGSGDGSGYGSDDGYGYGYGSGSGDGSGYGSDDGYGYGYGSGYGYGYGYGSGYEQAFKELKLI